MQDNNSRETVRNYLLNELFNWNKGKRCSLTLLKEHTCDDGRLLLKISIGPEKVFSLYCPVNYPLHEGTFFAETESVNHLWCNSLNEYIFDATDTLTLSAVLDKAHSLGISTVDSPSVSSDSPGISSESEEENEEFMVLDGDSESELSEKVLWDKMKKWRIKEQSVRCSMKSQDRSPLTRDPSKRPEAHQVFSKGAASGILTNDLVHIIRSSKETGIDVEPVDDNIYEWIVRFSNFSPECQLSKDLSKLEEVYNWNHIELHLRFSMDLYPFYPPVPHAIWPRPEGSFQCITACMDILKLSSWNPTRGMMSVLLEIKQYFASYATLKAEKCFHQSSLLSIECILLQLAFVGEIPPRCPEALFPAPPSHTEVAIHNLPSMESTFQSPPTPSISFQAVLPNQSANTFSPPRGTVFKVLNFAKFKSKKQHTFPDGTGYSTHSHQGWDINGLQAAKQQKDKKLESILEQVLSNLQEYLKMVDENANPSSLKKVLPVPVMPASYGEKWDPMTDLCEVLQASALIPFIEQKLKVDSFVEINQHKIVYRCIVDIVNEMASRSWLVTLLGKQPSQDASICDLLQAIREKAQTILDIFDKAEKRDARVEKGKKRANSGSRESLSRRMKDKLDIAKTSSAASSTNKASDPAVDDLELVRDLCELSMKVDLALKKFELSAPSTATPKVPPQEQELSATSSAEDDLASKYVTALKDLQFESCDIDVTDTKSFAHAASLAFGYTPSRSVVVRIAQELSSLSTSLPLDLASAIFVRTDDSKCTIMKAMIIGPEGTPYSGGCFLFDIMFPSNYPKVPPHVTLRTTGRNRVRFNPNLYSSGKVCLSLLGTWNGLQGEQWHETSTILQVLVSIQSLILVADPFFNEPGYEIKLGTAEGRTASVNYNHNVRYETVRLAMVEHLKYPPPNFEEVVKRHFLLKGDRIEKELRDYLKEYPLLANLKTVQKELSEELAKLRCEEENNM